MEKFAENLNKLWNNAKKTFNKGTKWVVENYKISIPIALCLVLIVVAAIVVSVSKKDTSASADAEGIPSETISMEPIQVSEMPLEENAYEAVNSFVSAYYQALADGNMDAVTSMRSYTDDTEKIKIQKKSEYIENYQNIICYTKTGPIENSYIAYVYYEVKFKDINTLAPGLNSLYLYPDETGNFKIGIGEMDDHIADYLKQASAQDNVVDLFNQVQVKYNEAVDADEALNAFLVELPTRLKTEVGEELAAAEATVSGNEAQSEEAAAQTEAPADETPAETQTVTVETVKTKTTVNVRTSDSETADKLGKATEGETYKRLEERANGWSKIEFEGKEAFIKTEFLEVVDTTTVEVTPEDTADTESNTDDLGKPAEGKIIVKETVNVRKTASETGEKMGVAYRGDQYEIVMKQADGWTKIKYKGKTAFVKSEFVE